MKAKTANEILNENSLHYGRFDDDANRARVTANEALKAMQEHTAQHLQAMAEEIAGKYRGTQIYKCACNMNHQSEYIKCHLQQCNKYNVDINDSILQTATDYINKISNQNK